MAIDRTGKRRNIAKLLAQKSAALMDVLYGLEELHAQYTAAGLAFADTDFDGVAGLQHLDAATAANTLGSIVAVGKFLRGDTSALTGAHITNFEQTRP